MDTETALWAWLLFQSGLPTIRGKELLQRWGDAGITPSEALQRLPASADALGLTRTEALRLAEAARSGLATNGQALVEATHVPSLTWADPRYPQGLLTLPLRQRPALLYYRGDPELLDRPLVYLPPADLVAENEETVREAISLLLGEFALLGACETSPQATLLLEEMAAAEGEVLLFARSGLPSDAASAKSSDPRISERLLRVSPLPPETAYRPAWDPLLQRVALAAASRVALTGEVRVPPEVEPREVAKPFIALPGATFDASREVLTAADIVSAHTPTDLLDWLAGDLLVSATKTSETIANATPEDTFGLGRQDVEPPPSTDDILAILRKGGDIPEALRRRLLGDE